MVSVIVEQNDSIKMVLKELTTLINSFVLMIKNRDINCELNSHSSDFNILSNFRSDEIEDDKNNGRRLKLDNDQEVEVKEIVTGNCVTNRNDMLINNSTF